MAHDVFVSSSSKDKTTADAVCATLEARGLRCWIAPRDILPGSNWGEAIIKALEGSRLMVLVFSSSANQSPQIRREVERAVHKAIPIIPLRIEDVRPEKSLEYFLSTPHWLDALTPPLAKHLDHLARISRQIIDGAPATRPMPAPRPGPPPPQAWLSKRTLFLAGAAAVLGLIALIWPRREGAAVEKDKPVKESFVGKWEAVEMKMRVPGADSPTPVTTWNLIGLVEMVDAALQAGKTTGRMEITALGQYTFDLAAEDHGTVTCSGNMAAIDTGFFGPNSMTPDNIQLTFVSAALKKPFTTSKFWAFRENPDHPTPGSSPGEISLMMETPSYQQTWLGKPGDRSENPRLPRLVVGQWRGQYPISGWYWSFRTLEVSPRGEFVFRPVTHERGLFEAANGKWKRTTSNGFPNEGTYVFERPDTVITADVHGTIKWKRVAE